MNHPDEARVILTTIEDDGRSSLEELTVASDLQWDASGNPLYKGSQLWGTADGVQTVGPGVNPGKIMEPWFPGPGGIRFRLFTFLPVTNSSGEASPAQPAGDHANESGDFAGSFDPDRPGMHISDTVDFVHILSGEIVLEMDCRELLLKQGDLVVVRGGWHNWRNETDQPCTVSSVMIGARRSS